MVFTPYQIKDITLKNRWVMLAMPTGYATGTALTEREIAFYEERARGGAAAVTMLLAVNAAGALKGMHDAETLEAESLRLLAEKVHAYDCRLFVQLFSSGGDSAALGQAAAFCRENGADALVIATAQEACAVRQAVGDFPVLAAAEKPIGAADGTILCGIRDEETAERLLSQGLCDLCGAGRAFLADHAFVERMQAKTPYLPCQNCGWCTEAMQAGRELSCAYNPEAGREWLERQRRKIATRKECIVLGGGLAGMEAAKKAAERGFKTTLLCREKELGGQRRLAALPSEKGDLLGYLGYMEYTLRALGVDIRTETAGTLSFLQEKKPYLTVFAIDAPEAQADAELIDWLMDERLSYAIVGDANGTDGDAIYDAYELFTRFYLA